ncbi:MAG: hypothetical protein U0941_29355 [Planctomycetaceae bacterium]
MEFTFHNPFCEHRKYVPRTKVATYWPAMLRSRSCLSGSDWKLKEVLFVEHYYDKARYAMGEQPEQTATGDKAKGK